MNAQITIAKSQGSQTTHEVRVGGTTLPRPHLIAAELVFSALSDFPLEAIQLLIN